MATKPGDDAGRTVEVAAIAHGVEMRPGHDARRTAILARQSHEQVGRVITARLEPHGFGTLCDQPVRKLLARPVGIAGHALAVAAAVAQLVEQRGDVLFLGHYGREDLGRRGKQWLSPQRHRVSAVSRL